MIPATVLLGSMAAGGLGLYLSGSTGSEPSTGIAKTVEDSVTSIADQVSKTTQDVTEYVSPKEETPEVMAPESEPEPVAEPVPVPEEPQPVPQPVAEPVPEEENRAVAPTLPEIDSMAGGQRGGFGRPTWAPLNAGTSLTQALGIVPGTPAGNALATATGSKTPQQIQQELVAIDEQIRALNASTFSLTREETQTNSDLSASRKALQDLEDEIFRNQKLITFLTGKINSTSSIQDTNIKLTKLVTDEVTPIFGGPPDNMQVGGKKKGKPGKPGGTGAFTPTDKQKEWLVKTLRYFRNLPDEDRDDDIPDLFRVENKKDLDREATGSPKIPVYTDETTLAGSGAFNLTTVPTDDAEKALAIKWWNFLRGKVHQEDIDPTKVQADLIGFMTQKRTYDDTLRQSEYKIPDAKEKTKEKEDELQEIRLKLSENKKKKKELEASRGLLLKELSSYKVPQSFWDKKEVRPSVLPTGEALNKLLIEYRQIEDDIARNEREKNDYVSIQLASDPSWSGDERYTEIIGRETDLENKKSNKIAEIEGRAPSQLDQLKENPFQAFARELSRDKLTKQAGELLLKTSFPEVFKMYLELSKASSDTIYDKVDKYYNFFKKGLQSFNGQDVSRAFVFFYGLGKETRLSPELKTKATNFSTLNKEIIANALTNLELALQGIKTPTVEERSIVEQALMSGESIPWKTLKRAGVALDVSHLFTKSVQQKLVILKDTFRERIYDKLKDVSIKYGLWGKQEISGYRQTIESSFDVYKALLVQEITTFNTLLATWEATDPKQREKQPINDSLTKIRGLARLVMTLLQEGDTLREELTTILDNSEYSSQFKGGAKLTLAEFKETLQRINVALQEPNNSRGLVVDGNKALFDQLVQAKAMIIKKNIYLSFAIRKDWSVKTKLDIANELLQAYDDLGKAFESLYQSQTTEKQASTLEKDFKEYGKARDELKKKIEQTAIDVKAKLAKEASEKELRDLEDSTKDPSLLSIVNLSSKLVTILGGIIPSSSTASKVGSLAAYLFSGKVSVDDIKTALKNIGAFFSKFSWSSKITARPLPEDPKLSSIDKETLQDLVDAFSSLPPDIDSYENLPKSDLSSIFKTLVNSGRLVESLEALNPNVVNFKQQYEVLLDLIEEYADQERIPLTGGAGSAMDKEARKRRNQVRKEKQETEDARLISNYKRSQNRSRVDQIRGVSDYREKQVRGDLPFDEENQEQLLEERQEQTNSSGTPIGTLLEQLKRVLTLASTLAESQGISLSDNTFKPAVREEQKPSFDDEEEENIEDAGTDADKKVFCVENVGDTFLWNGLTYAVTSIQTKNFEDCLETFTANIPSASDRTEYNVKVNNSGRIESFEAVEPEEEDDKDRDQVSLELVNVTDKEASVKFSELPDNFIQGYRLTNMSTNESKNISFVPPGGAIWNMMPTANPIIVKNLLPNTEYNIIVGSLKSRDDPISTSSPLTFKTAPAPLPAPIIDPSPFAAPGQALMVGSFVKLKPVTSKTYDENGLLYKSRGRLKFGKITELIGGTDARVQSYDLFPKSKIPTKGQPARYALVDLVKTTPQAEGVDPTIVFGGGYTRRHRVRGMPKRLKTRRTY